MSKTAVDQFTYLGSTLSSAANINAKINNRKASVTFGKLRHSVWQRKGLCLKSKLKFYKAMVLSTLLRQLLNIKWQDKVPDKGVLEQTGLPSIHTILQKTKSGDLVI